MSTLTQTTAACALALALATPMAAHAAEAMRVVRDPVTGEMRGPTAAEAAAFAKAEAQLRLGSAKATPKAPIEIHYPDGTVETKLGEDSMMFSVVSANADGTLTFDCLPADQAKAFVKTKAPGAAKSKAQAAKKVNHDH